MKSEPGDETRLVTLEAASRLAGLTPEDFMAAALATADLGPNYSTTIVHGPGGPWFDPIECEGLGHILAGLKYELGIE